MLIAVLAEKTVSGMLHAASTLEPGLYDGIELRLDGCGGMSADDLANLADLVNSGNITGPAAPSSPAGPLPVIFTLRAAREGGSFSGDEETRLNFLEKLARLRPAYLDVEAFVPAERIARIREASPSTRIILSSHDFLATPEDLDAHLAAMRAKAENVIYKVAAMAGNTADALRMLDFCARATARGIPVAGISMGEYGECTRILAPVFHTGLCYCPVRESTAPGQLDAATLVSVYNAKALNKETTVYGLLGDPVSQSIGHIFHNRRNREAGCNAVYVKWRATAAELPEILPLLRAIRARGLSVTMPLKQAVMPLLASVDEAGQAIGAVNTLRLEKDGYAATNTDGAGALDSMPFPVRGKDVVILGAGGAARAIAHEALLRGARVRVFNRNARLARSGQPGQPGQPGWPGWPGFPGGAILPFERLDECAGADVICNTLPFDAEYDFSRVPFRPGCLAYDISYGKHSRFLERAGKIGCEILDGEKMFAAQAVLQRRWWGLEEQNPFHNGL